jgi:hypothetical protein
MKTNPSLSAGRSTRVNASLARRHEVTTTRDGSTSCVEDDVLLPAHQYAQDGSHAASHRMLHRPYGEAVASKDVQATRPAPMVFAQQAYPYTHCPIHMTERARFYMNHR